MFNLIRLVTLSPLTDEAITADALVRWRGSAEHSGAAQTLVEATLPGVRNGGDILIRLGFETAAELSAGRAVIDTALDDPLVVQVDGAEFHDDGAVSGRRDVPGPGGVFRALLLRVSDDAASAAIAEFERHLLAMPPLVEPMVAWQLTRLTAPRGGAAWTHLWEQEFTDLAGLTGPYMLHPIHWGLVDTWFDPENPRHIVEGVVCHSFCPSPTAVLDTAGDRTAAARSPAP